MLRRSKQAKSGPARDRSRRMPSEPASGKPTFSYYANRTPAATTAEPTTPVRRTPEAPRAATQSAKRTSKLSLIPFILLLLVVVVCLVKVLTLTTNPTVVILDQTALSRTYTHPVTTYEHAASVLLTASPTSRFKFTIDTNGVAAKLQTEFPELAAASITLPLVGNRPIIYVSPAQPSILLAGDDGHVIAVSHNGLALAQITAPTSSAIPEVHDQSGAILKVGTQVIPGSTVQFIETVLYQLRAGKQTVASLTLPKAAPYELDLTLTGKSYVVKFNLQGDAKEQAGTLLATVISLGTTQPQSYIDVRVPGRIYYK